MSQASSVSETEAGADRSRLAKLLAWARGVVVADGDRERTQRDAIFAFAVRIGSAGILYLSQVLLARWMGGYEYGIYVSVWTWVLVIGGLSHLGFNMAMMRLLPEYRERGEDDYLRGLLFGGRLLAFALSTVIALLGMAGLMVFGQILSSPYLMPAYLALVCVPMYVLSDVQDGIGRGRGWMGIALLPIYILRPLLVLLAMWAAHLGGLAMCSMTAAGAAIFATWVSAFVQTVLVERRLAAEIAPGPRRYAFKSWFATALPLLAIGFSDIVLQNADVLIIARYLTPTDVGIYFAAAKTMSLIMFVHYAVGSAVANRFATLNTRGDRAALESSVRDAVNWTFWPSLLGAAIILSLGGPLLSLFGPKFADAYPLMFILAAGFLVRASFGPAEFLLNMLGQQAMCARVLGTAAALNIGLNLVMVPMWGLYGAACASAFSLIAASIANSMVARRRLRLETSILMHWLNKSPRA